jgi:hypothetical protein
LIFDALTNIHAAFLGSSNTHATYFVPVCNFLPNFISFLHNLASLYGSRRRLYSHRAPHVVEADVPAAPDNALNGVALDFRLR